MPRTHSSNRLAISSVRSPDTPQLRKRVSSSRRSAQYSYWLCSSATPAPSESRVALSGSHSGAPAVIESPRAVTTVPPSCPPPCPPPDPEPPQAARVIATTAAISTFLDRMTPDPLASFTPSVREWFARSFEAPTDAQREAWPAIAGGENVLVSAPTGSGKTLAAFLWGLDRLVAEPTEGERRTRLVYVSPLKALSYDVEKNLRAPLKGIGGDVEVAIRTGDTPQRERQQMLRRPPDVLITTPESLYLMLTSRARETLSDVEAVIVDEIHAVAQTKRGAHLSLTLERLEHQCGGGLQRIGLSATQRPLEEVGRFLVGVGRECRIVDSGRRKPLDLEIQVPVEDMREPGAPDIIHPEVEATGTMSGGGDLIGDDPGEAEQAATRRSIWPAIYPQLLELVQEHRSTIIFVNNRRGAERLAVRLNELAGEDGVPAEIARAHHGSLAREERLVVEDLLKSGELPCLVATSSLELGIDMGAVDLVLQVESPKSVTAGLQRIGRAGHGVGEVSKGRIFPKFRADLLECAVVTRRMREGEIEQTVVPRNPLDVLAQHVVAMTAGGDEWRAAELHELVRTAYPFAELSRELLDQVLDMLDGRYPSEEFSELRPRIVWDRVQDTIRARKGALQLAVTNAGTIPDRGLYGVHLPDGRRVGELDEEMVYEARPGQTFLLGASTWRIEEITRDRVIVSPAPGAPGAVPFWKRRRRGPPRRAGPRDRRLRPRRGGQGARASWPPRTTSTSARPRTSSPTCASSRRPPGCCPATARW